MNPGVPTRAAADRFPRVRGPRPLLSAKAESALSPRQLALLEELEALLTAPVTDIQVILSKYFGAISFYVVMLVFIGVNLAVKPSGRSKASVVGAPESPGLRQ